MPTPFHDERLSDAHRLRRAAPRGLAMLWCVSLGGFALTTSYPLALVLLFCAGFVELSFNAMAQTLARLNAPAEMRGHAIGVFKMFAMDMRTFSGVTVGLVRARIGIRNSLALSAALTFAVIGVLLRFGVESASQL